MTHLSGNATWTNTAATPVTAATLENIEGQLDTFAATWTGGRWVPVDHGLLAWTYDARLGTDLSVPLSGGLFFHQAIKVPVTTTCTGCGLAVATAGTTMTSGQSKVVLYNATGTQVAITADQSTSWNSTGNKTIPWVTPFTITPGTYWACIVANSTGTATQMWCSGLANPPKVSIQFGRTAATARMGTSTGVTTTIPTTRPTPSSLTVPAIWVGLY